MSRNINTQVPGTFMAPLQSNNGAMVNVAPMAPMWHPCITTQQWCNGERGTHAEAGSRRGGQVIAPGTDSQLNYSF